LNRHDAKTPRDSWCEEGQTRVEGDLKFGIVRLKSWRDISSFWRLGVLAVQICVSLVLGVPLTGGFMDGMMSD
jgi:hypothetical protein